jgi:hypothetical protein
MKENYIHLTNFVRICSIVSEMNYTDGQTYVLPRLRSFYVICEKTIQNHNWSLAI